MNDQDPPSPRVVEQRLRNRAMEALEALGDGNAGVLAVGVGSTPRVCSEAEFIDSGWPVRIQPSAAAALGLMRTRGRFREDVEEGLPAAPP